jgi:hypothetical protein
MGGERVFLYMLYLLIFRCQLKNCITHQINSSASYVYGSSCSTQCPWFTTLSPEKIICHQHLHVKNECLQTLIPMNAVLNWENEVSVVRSETVILADSSTSTGTQRLNHPHLGSPPRDKSPTPWINFDGRHPHLTCLLLI